MAKYKATNEQDRCVACGGCVKVCPKDAISIYKGCYAQIDEAKCIGCGICASRCPAGISHPMVGELARRLNGKYIVPKAEHLKNRVEEIHEGKFDDLIEQVMGKPIDEIQELYNNREIEK